MLWETFSTRIYRSVQNTQRSLQDTTQEQKNFFTPNPQRWKGEGISQWPWITVVRHQIESLMANKVTCHAVTANLALVKHSYCWTLLASLLLVQEWEVWYLAINSWSTCVGFVSAQRFCFKQEANIPSMYGIVQSVVTPAACDLPSQTLLLFHLENFYYSCVIKPLLP